ncbi:MAG: redoxin domain-containing protein [Acidobacteria bacterium]|nr:redoxin domain-containing protein [Acidobacteriota bacterium]
MLMKTFITMAFMIWGMACTPGGSTLNNQQSPAQTKARSTPVGVGDVAPDFTLEDQSGNKITLSEARGRSPVTLVFYRGYW